MFLFFGRFLINGDDGLESAASEQMYSSFSWDGVVDQGGKPLTSLLPLFLSFFFAFYNFSLLALHPFLFSLLYLIPSFQVQPVIIT